jgi:hypothetical protein
MNVPPLSLFACQPIRPGITGCHGKTMLPQDSGFLKALDIV